VALLRNLVLLVALAVVAVLAGAGAQELLVRLFPGLRSISPGITDLGSWLGFATLAVAFAGYGWLSLPRVVGAQRWRVALVVGVPVALAVANWLGSENSLVCRSNPAAAICALTVLMYGSPTLGAIAGVLLRMASPANRQPSPAE
jgi:hypothetical protein